MSVKADVSVGVICHCTVTVPNRPAVLYTVTTPLPPSCIRIVSYVYSAKAIIPAGLSFAGIAMLEVRGCERRPPPVTDVKVTVWVSYSSGTPSCRAPNSNALEVSPYNNSNNNNNI